MRNYEVIRLRDHFFEKTNDIKYNAKREDNEYTGTFIKAQENY